MSNKHSRFACAWCFKTTDPSWSRGYACVPRVWGLDMIYVHFECIEPAQAVLMLLGLLPIQREG